jgi:hypothetical protein
MEIKTTEWLSVEFYKSVSVPFCNSTTELFKLCTEYCRSSWGLTRKILPSAQYDVKVTADWDLSIFGVSVYVLYCCVAAQFTFRNCRYTQVTRSALLWPQCWTGELYREQMLRFSGLVNNWYSSGRFLVILWILFRVSKRTQTVIGASLNSRYF